MSAGRVSRGIGLHPGLVRHRRRFRTERPGAELPSRGHPTGAVRSRSPRVQYVHLNVADIYGQRGRAAGDISGAYHRIEDLTIPSMDRVYVVNEDGVRFYRDRHPRQADRFSFLPTWYDPGIFWSPTSEERPPHGSPPGNSSASPTRRRSCSSSGRLEAQKDPELVVEPSPRAAERVAGTSTRGGWCGRMDGAVRRTAERLGVGRRVHLLGALPRPQVAEQMWAADALLLASRFEGMPITVIEALATGLPVVATAVGEVPRLVRTGERAGWLPTDLARPWRPALSASSTRRWSRCERRGEARRDLSCRSVLGPSTPPPRTREPVRARLHRS